MVSTLFAVLVLIKGKCTKEHPRTKPSYLEFLMHDNLLVSHNGHSIFICFSLVIYL